jgi:hypothetical protein
MYGIFFCCAGRTSPAKYIDRLYYRLRQFFYSFLFFFFLSGQVLVSSSSVYVYNAAVLHQSMDLELL